MNISVEYMFEKVKLNYDDFNKGNPFKRNVCSTVSAPIYLPEHVNPLYVSMHMHTNPFGVL